MATDCQRSLMMKHRNTPEVHPRPPCTQASTLTLLALERLVSAGVSAAAVLSADGALMANLSVSDLRSIQPGVLGLGFGERGETFELKGGPFEFECRTEGEGLGRVWGGRREGWA